MVYFSYFGKQQLAEQPHLLHTWHSRGGSSSKPTGRMLGSSETLGPMTTSSTGTRNGGEVSDQEVCPGPRITTFHSSVMVRHVDITEIDEGRK